MNKDLQISILTEELTVARALLRVKEAELSKVRSELELAKMKDALFFNESVSKSLLIDNEFWNDWVKVARGIEEMPHEFNEIINNNFWEMIGESEKKS